MERRQYAIIETALGWVGIMRSRLGVCATTLPHQTPAGALLDLRIDSTAEEVDEDVLGSLAGRVRACVKGKPCLAGVECDLSSGTPFQQAVWRAIQLIPRGETRSYGWIAESVGRPRAARAVGQAVRRNPLPLLIPCHRVIAADGSLGGFSGGYQALPAKRSLLHAEGVHYEGPVLEQMRIDEQ